MLEISKKDYGTILRSTGILQRVVRTSCIPDSVEMTEARCLVGKLAFTNAGSGVVLESSKEVQC